MSNAVTNINESEVLILIDQFMQSLYKTKFNEQHFKMKLKQLVPLFKTIYKAHLKYIKSIDSFQKMISSLNEFLKFPECQSIDHLTAPQLQFLWNNALYDAINITEQLGLFKSQERDNQKSLETYIKQLTQHYAKLLFIRIDLSIEQKHQHVIGIEQFHAYLRNFINRMQNQDTCFKDLQGYAWAIEQGETKGYHCHVLLIYDGHKHQKDFGMAIQVGQCWSEITANKGYYFTSNDPDYKARFLQKGKLGIGMIHRSNPEQVLNAINAAMYLVNPEKEDQHLRVKVKKMRSFGKGQYEIEKRRGCVTSTLAVAQGFKLCTDYYD